MTPATPQPDSTWYKDAIIYQLHVRSFFDANDDGVGDFRGLLQKLDYVQSLGVNAIWLLPFYPSPLRDDGYDIANYRDVNPAYGTLRDFKEFLREAHERGLRVFTELVVNHTSDQHQWFQAARQAPRGSSKRGYYVWSDTGQEYADTRIIFGDTESSNWAWDPVAKQYFWHRFFSHQPDLNYDNPRVFSAIVDTMNFWLDMGVDGMRLDAVPYLIEREGTPCENLKETHDVLKRLRAALDARYADRALLAEANMWPADVRPYFGDGDECHMAFHFPLMPRMFMAVRQEDALPIVEIMRQTPDLPATCQWALFLRNHDELTLETVTDEERDYMYRAYAADPQMRLNLGIRRRLSPLLEHNRPLTELLNSLLLSLPGSPVIYYGDEIGMGDNVYLGDRNGVRTPMQWTGDRNGGFSRADPNRLFAPPIMDPVYGFQAVNVESQERSQSSLLNWMRRLLALRRQHGAFGRGSFEAVATDNRRVLAFLREDGDETLLVVANMARTMQPVHLDLQRFDGRYPVEMFGGTELPPVGATPYFLTLSPHGFYWFQLAQVARPLVLQRPRLATRDEPVPRLLVGSVWTSLLDSHTKTLIERDALPAFLARQRWFSGKARRIVSARFVDWVGLDTVTPLFLAIIEVTYDQGAPDRHCLVVAAASGDAARVVEQQWRDAMLATLSGAKAGVLYDGLVDAPVVDRVIEALKRGVPIPMRAGTLHVGFGDALVGDLMRDTPPKISVPLAEQNNSSVLVGERYLLKLFRRLHQGENPDVEVGRAIGTRAPDAHVPALLAWAEYRTPNAAPTSIAMVQQQVLNRGSAWQRALDEVRKYCETAQVAQRGKLDRHDHAPPTSLEVRDAMGAYRASLELLGRRTADLHRTLSSLDREGFGVFPTSADELTVLARTMNVAAARALGEARNARATLSEQAERVLAQLDVAAPMVEQISQRLVGLVERGCRIRVHGDFHLGQVLETDGDFVFIDFEGQAALGLAERRVPQSPLADAASMLRSIGYAARAGFRLFLDTQPDDRGALDSWVDGWEEQAGLAFLGGYQSAMTDAGLLPASEQSRELLLRALLVAKAFDELTAEIRTRPEWADIPLRALLRLLTVEPPATS